jgi:hypothetical protein
MSVTNNDSIEIRSTINNCGTLSPKSLYTTAGYIHMWYANNKGNRHNTTIIRSSSKIRAAKSADQTEVLASITCNFFGGRPFISYKNAEKLI